MKKEFYPEINHNRQKRRNAVVLSVLLFVCMLGMISLFLVNKDYPFAVFFALFLFLPVISIPSAFSSYPVDGKPFITITDKDITISKNTVKLKDVIRVKIIIELPASKIDSENLALLDKMKTEKPEDIFYGNFDVIYYDEKGRTRTLYGHIDGVIGALYTALEIGVKNYTLTYSIKKNVVRSEYDFKRDIALKKELENQQASKKQKAKQLI